MNREVVPGMLFESSSEGGYELDRVGSDGDSVGGGSAAGSDVRPGSAAGDVEAGGWYASEAHSSLGGGSSGGEGSTADDESSETQQARLTHVFGLISVDDVEGILRLVSQQALPSGTARLEVRMRRGSGDEFGALAPRDRSARRLQKSIVYVQQKYLFAEEFLRRQIRAFRSQDTPSALDRRASSSGDGHHSAVDEQAYETQHLTTLHLAVLYGRQDIARLLIESGLADLGAPILQPSEERRKQIQETARRREAQGEIIDADRTKAKLAAVRGEWVRRENVFHLCARLGRVEMLDLLLSYARFPEDWAYVYGQDDRGHTPITLAIKYGHTEILHTLSASGCDISGIPSALHNPDHFTEFQLDVRVSKRMALMYAVRRKCSPAMLQFLLDFGCDPNWRALDGTSCLHTAAEAGDLSNLETLLGHGANPNVLQKRTLESPLTRGLERMVRLRQLSKNTGTLEHMGVRSDLQETYKVCQALLDHGASVKWARTDTGMSPLYFAAENRLGALLLHPSFEYELEQLWKWPWSFNPIWWCRNFKHVLHNPRVSFVASATATVVFTLLWGILFLYWQTGYTGVHYDLNQSIQRPLFQQPFSVQNQFQNPFDLLLNNNSSSFSSSSSSTSSTLTFDEIKSIEEFWNWMAGPLYQTVLFPSDTKSNCGYQASQDCADGFFQRYNRVVGMHVRLRQLRVSSRRCLRSLSGLINGACWPSYTEEVESTDDYGLAPAPGWQFSKNNYGTFFAHGGVWTYPEAGGFVVDLSTLPIDRNNTLRTLRNLYSNRWVDVQTAALLVEFSVYNGNIDAFAFVRVEISFPNSAATIPTQSTVIFPPSRNMDRAVVVFLTMLEILMWFYVIGIVLDDIRRFMAAGIRWYVVGCFWFPYPEYLRQGWNWVRLCIYIGFTLYFAFVITYSAKEYQLRFHGDDVWGYINTSELARYSLYQRYVGALTLTLLWIKVGEFMRENTRIGVLILAISRLVKDFMVWFALWLILLISFALGFYVMSGQDMKEFRAPWFAWITMFRTATGSWEQVWTSFDNVAATATYVIFVLYTLVMAVIMWNVLLAVFVYGYSQELARSKVKYAITSAQLVLNYYEDPALSREFAARAVRLMKTELRRQRLDAGAHGMRLRKDPMARNKLGRRLLVIDTDAILRENPASRSVQAHRNDESSELAIGPAGSSAGRNSRIRQNEAYALLAPDQIAHIDKLLKNRFRILEDKLILRLELLQKKMSDMEDLMTKTELFV